ncbi:MAG TPA: TonB-dependent receptor [Pedomonas sp.]|uniref:TonB-dependent receptor n=1 Tax=Pedomonas sp. TaxID=2976421 RepID=UPI002F406C3D
MTPVKQGNTRCLKQYFIFLHATAALMLTPMLAHAQSNDQAPADAPAQASGTASYGLEEIVVTAQKRSESMQRTPLAISAVGIEAIESRRISDATMLGSLAPNLTTTTGPSTKNHVIVQIRGVGESEPILTADSPVGVYVDGVIMGRSTGAAFELLDLERIEVLRGPQGTLYGRNTTGGAVSIVTKKPADEFGVDATASYGNRDYWQGKLSVDTGEFGDTGIKAKIHYLHKQADGYVDNISQKGSRDPGAYNTDAFRIGLAYDKGGDFRMTYSFDWIDTRAVASLSQITVANQNLIDYFSRSASLGGTEFLGPSAERRDWANPDVTSTHDRNISHTINAEVDLTDSMTLRLITGFRKWKSTILETDLDGNSGLRGLVMNPATGQVSVQPVHVFGADSFRRQSQFSQEINLVGNLGERLEYVLGAYYFHEKSREENPQFFTLVRNMGPLGLVGINVNTNLKYEHKNDSQALFGQATYHITDTLSFTGGLRYTEDQKQLLVFTNTLGQLNRDFSKLNYAGTLSWQATPDVMAYARVATGYKAGGFSARAVNTGYDPETVTNYEVGFKSDLFDRRLRFNATLFYMDLKDKQLNQLVAGTGGSATQTINAGKADFKGVEVEFEALPFEGLRLNGSFGYVDRNFSELLALDPATDTIRDYSDVAQFTYSSSKTFTAGAEYTFGDVGAGVLSVRVDYSYKGRVGFNILPVLPFSPYDADIAAPAYGLWDARVMLADVPLGRTEALITLWGKNITNKDYRTAGIDFGSLGFATSNYGEPRSYGLDVRVKF